MAKQVIVLNGGSSSGTSTIARSLQEILPEPWLTFGVDTLIGAMPSSMTAAADGIEFTPDGQVNTGVSFARLDDAFSVGIAAMARAGAHVIIDDVFLGQAASQARWSAALIGLDVLWVGVRCDGDVAESRETQRGDRVRGMARSQADLVHRGVRYDLEVDTTATEAAECAAIIAGGLADADR